MYVEEYDLFDRDSGTGSRSTREDWIDANTTAGEDIFSESQTTFRPDDAPKHMQQKYERLKEWDGGKWSSENSTHNRRAMMEADAKMFCNMLDLSSAEMEEVIHVVEASDMSSNNFGGKPYEKVIVTIITLVSDKYTDSMDNRIIYHEMFDQILEHISMDRSEHTKLRQSVRERTEFKLADK